MPARESGWFQTLKNGLAPVSSPRWAFAAAALVLVAVSIPVLVWRAGTLGDGRSASTTAQKVPEVEAAVPAASESQPEARAGNLAPVPAAAPEAEEPQGYVADAPKKSAREAADSAKAGEGRARAESNEQVPGAVVGASVPAATSSDFKKRDGTDVAPRADESQQKFVATDRAAQTESQAQPPAQDRSVDRSQERSDSQTLARINKEEALKLPAEDKHSASVTKLKPGFTEIGPKTEREKVTAITAKDSEAPATKGAETESRRTLSRRSGSRALIDSTAARAKSPERKVGKKTFWLSKGVWTDTDFKADDKMPFVTVIRNSDVYKELLEKNNKLKMFLGGFAESERAIIVFKNTVYKLIPQDNR